MTKIEQIIEAFPDETFMKADGFDDAIIGVDHCHSAPRLIYSVSKCYAILVVDEEMTLEDAMEHFSYNVRGSYIGEQTPIWCEDWMLDDDEDSIFY